MLHIDRNNYYGGDCASLNLTNLYKKFIKNEEPPKAFFDALGANRDYNVRSARARASPRAPPRSSASTRPLARARASRRWT